MAIKFKKTNKFNLLILFLFSIFFSINIIKNLDLSYYSPFDEHAHFDYWYKVYELHKIPIKFEKVSNKTTEIWACSGEPAFKHLKCGGINNVNDMPWAGENSASEYMPTYYFMTAQVTKVIVIINRLFDSNYIINYFELAKKSTVIWGIFSIFLLSSLTLAFNFRLYLSLFLVSICSNVPFFVDLSTSISPEIFSLFASLLLLNLYFFYFKDKKRCGWNLFLLSLISGICLTAKETSMVSLVIISIYELYKKTNRKDNLIFIIKYLFGSMFVYCAFVVIVNLYRGSLAPNYLMINLIRSLPKLDFISTVSFVIASYNESAFQPVWRNLNYIYDVNLWGTKTILLFSKYQLYFNVLILCFFYKFTSKNSTLNGTIFLKGWLVSVVMLPILMAIKLKISHIPFYFQPRYYINFLIFGYFGLFLLINDFLNMVSFKIFSSLFKLRK